jgi:hypothetical protein
MTDTLQSDKFNRREFNRNEVVFKKMAGEEFVQMWHWLGEEVEKQGLQAMKQIVEETRQIHPEMLDMDRWL